jgi:hemerythrin-like domain-containing protein
MLRQTLPTFSYIDASHRPPRSDHPNQGEIPMATRAEKDACDLLDADHKAVKAMFKEYETLTESRSRSSAKKRQLADQICKALTVHATIEEEIFYPAFRRAVGDDEMVDEAEEEHDEARDLITEIEDAEAMDPLIARLQQAIEHHVKEERAEMFPKARQTPGLDLLALGAELESRKRELMSGTGSA